jgi:hypothetical protein
MILLILVNNLTKLAKSAKL